MNPFLKIQERLTLVEVIEDYIPVLDRGQYMVAICPFHQEKRPSLSISKEKNVYYCFGCMASGNMFTFVQNIENISKKEALEKLAKKAGVVLDDNNNNNLELGYKLLTTVSNLYNQVLLHYLKTDNYLSKYIDSRKLATHTLNLFQIGYAPTDNFLVKFLEKNKIDLDLALKVGLLVLKNGQLKDKFANRLMIPIKNEQGQVVGFTGRNFPNETYDRPKYLNSPDSEYFNKSRLLFGLDIAKQNILKKKQVILVEGNMDVIASTQSNIVNTIATQGTSTTVEQIKKIAKLQADLVLAFDNDTAGQVAELKILKMALEEDINTFKLIIPKEYKDLDEYLKISSDLIIVPYLKHLVENQVELKDKDIYVQKKAINQLVQMVGNCSPIVKAQTLQLIQETTLLEEEILKDLFLMIPKKTAEYKPVLTVHSPITAMFYQLLANDSKNPALETIYYSIKNQLNFVMDNYTDYLAQNEIEWIIQSQEIIEDRQLQNNLISLIIRQYPEKREQLRGLYLINVN